MARPTTAYIGLGGNVGDRRRFIDEALRLLSESEQVELSRTGAVVETDALGPAKQGPYLNAVAEVSTTLSAEGLLRELARIEAELGRVRGERWGPRTIDLDLLLFGDEVISLPNLCVPHPQMHLRSFVVRGLCELEAELIHPVLKVSVCELAERLNGGDFAPDPGLPQLVSIAGNIGVGKTTLAKKLAEHLGCPLLLEPYDANPFMPEVYAGRKELALNSQLYFLTSRVDQLDPKALAGGRAVVTDYVFEKECIYAARLLDSRQLELYNKVYKALAEKVVRPVLVIYLRDSAPNCLARIHSRNRPYEQGIEAGFLRDLDGDYEGLMGRWKTCPVIRLRTTELDYTNEQTVERLAGQVRYYLAGRVAAGACSSVREDS